jgi:prepilin peptidase dependent protein B
VSAARHRQTGFSLVELMIALALGLFVTAVGLAAMTSHLRESRKLLVEARLMQDLRATSDVMSRNLRRAGHWQGAGAGVWTGQANPVSAWTTSHNQLDMAYEREGAANDRYAFRLRDGVIDLQIGNGPWQAMTDAGTAFITALDIEPQVQETALDGLCTRACAAGSTTCPPRMEIRSVALRIDARSASDATFTRSVQTTVRLRNDRIVGACP